MKRIFTVVLLLMVSVASFAQSSNAEAFHSARRQKLKVKKAEGYTIVAADIFNSKQTISVIKYSPKSFTTEILLPDEVGIVSEAAEEKRAHIAINACYWAVKTGVPTTFIKVDGNILSHSHTAGLPRVNGLMFFYDHGIEVVSTEEMPDYPSLAEKVDKCKNVFACGPILIDDGKRVSYDHITSSTLPSLKRKIPFFIRRHPRTAVGCDANGDIYLVVVDGRAKDCAAGVTIAELTDICEWLGLVEAMNLDGGSSSTMWTSKHGVVNYPCGNRKFDHEGERKVLSKLLVTAKKTKKTKKR